MKDKILVFVAHSDDETIGMGGTIIKFARENINVTTVLVSNGEGSSPWLNKEIVINERLKEAKEIGKFLGTEETIFLGLKDGKLSEELDTPEIEKKIKEIIIEFKPTKIFTHSSFDAHTDHRAVNKAITKILVSLDPQKKISFYAFEVWNVIEESHPRIYIDISTTFKKKIQALKKFKSQKVFTYTLLVPIVYKAIIAGIMNKCKYAERFYKLR
ncbi:MAG TPA: PIG-L deacetylase family protein [Candidatus Nanoarchaeia archaeon]|nr:PIG-L deacetylase family protein [Candidatus Nanoarchaeia archaeon]